MNAKEARKQSIINAQPQIERLEKQINDAVAKGESSIMFDEKVLTGTYLWLSDNEYKHLQYIGKIEIMW